MTIIFRYVGNIMKIIEKKKENITRIIVKLIKKYVKHNSIGILRKEKQGEIHITTLNIMILKSQVYVVYSDKR